MFFKISLFSYSPFYLQDHKISLSLMQSLTGLILSTTACHHCQVKCVFPSLSFFYSFSVGIFCLVLWIQSTNYPTLAQNPTHLIVDTAVVPPLEFTELVFLAPGQPAAMTKTQRNQEQFRSLFSQGSLGDNSLEDSSVLLQPLPFLRASDSSFKYLC